MAIRNILKIGEDDLLKKRSREVEVIDGRIHTLLDDMLDTMHLASGVGLAAPQVGVLKRVVIIEIEETLYELINPVIIRQYGGAVANEGCLSLPGRYAEVERPEKIVVEALDRRGKQIRIKGEGHLARALSHEIDHLEGVVITDKAIKFID